MPTAPALRGSITALITPMTDAGEIDAAAFAAFIDWQITQGTSAIVPAGTTGESPTLTHEEHRRIIEIAVQAAAGRVPVIAGAGSNSTAEAIDLATHARGAGADAVMVVTPYYNKPSQEGLYRHYMAIADAADLPLIIYNIPSRSVIDMTPETMARLAAHARIVGVKDATANLARPLHTSALCGPDFIQLSGEDHTALSFLAAGGTGCISVTANAAPALCAAMHAAWAEGRLADAMAIQARLLPLHDAMFCEASPGPAKFAVSLLDRATPHLRLPLAPITEAAQIRVHAAMAGLGLLA
jgi:4-hydroxy-tetrahydrodipicolinate synthase